MECFDSYAKAKRAFNKHGGFLLELLDVRPSCRPSRLARPGSKPRRFTCDLVRIYAVCDYEDALDMRNPPPDDFATAEEYLASLAPHFDETREKVE